MISVHALAFKNKKTIKMIEKSPLENPFALQIAGNDFGIIQKAVEFLNEFKNEIQILDLNCGCPAPKVSSHGSGSSLLKGRLGFDKKIPLEIANALNDSPIDYVVVHGRTKSDGYKKDKIDYDSIRLIKQNIQHPLIANGEITSPQIAKKVQELTGAEGVMIGRAAIEKPWIFTQIKNNLEESIELRKQVALEHFDRTISFRGDYGAIMFRKNLHAYSKGLKGTSDFRNKVNAITNPALMREENFNFFTHSSFEN